MLEPKQRIIFAIGGGEIGEYETWPIDKVIVAAAAKNRDSKRGKVKALFIPTASGDDPEYIETFDKIYGYTLGCTTDHLLLYDRKTSRASLKRQIDRCDLVYVGGGSTPAMMRLWRRYGIDRYLKSAWRRGVVLSGLSAGSNCWFKWGLSDAYPGRFTAVSGLGLIDYAGNVHYSSFRGRKKYFDELVRKKRMSGIALEDNVCIKIFGKFYELIRSDKAANAYWVYNDGGKIRRVIMPDVGKLGKTLSLK